LKEVLRRTVLAAGGLAPLGAVVAMARRARGAVVGARPFADSRVEGTGFPRRLVDAAGELRLLPRPPVRIVSTYLACEEMLAALVPVARVVGVSVFADDASTSNCAGFYPPRVARLHAEPERVLALEPDLVCVAGYTDIEALRLLAGAHLPLLRWARLDSFADVLAGLRLLGAAVGEDARAEELAAAVEAELADVERRVRGVRAPRVLYYDTPGYTMGAATLVDEIITRAGGRNAAAELGMRGPGQLGVEMVLALDPDVIVMPRYGTGETAAAIAREQATSSSFRRVVGGASARIREVPASTITSVSQHAARGLALVARLLHPEVF